MIEVLHAGVSHRYLGRMLNLDKEVRVQAEFDHRRNQAWATFHKHKKVLLNKHKSLRLRFKYFDCSVTPAMLFALHAFSITNTRLLQFNILQRKMLRRIIGWRRINGESWEDRMHRMDERFSFGQFLYNYKV